MKRFPSRPPSVPDHRRNPCPTLFILAALLVASGVAPRSAEEGVAGTAPSQAIPLGSILAFGGPATAIPEARGWMLCDGRELSVASHPNLHAAIGDAWGGGGGKFRLPDLRGRFLRGVTYDAAGDRRGPDHDSRTSSGPGGNAGNEVGSLQDDAVGPHVHALRGVGDATGPGYAGEWVRFYAAKVPDDDAPIASSSWAVQPGDGTETRPRNANVNWMIRVR